jgi:hypothetical protein
MKDTIVEWLVDKLKSQGLLIGEIDNLVAVNQAKEMEKEEQQKLGIILAIFAEEISDKKFTELLIRAEQYYNETYNNK